MKFTIVLLIMLALLFGPETKAQDLRPSVTIDMDLGLDNSEFKQGPEWSGQSTFDYNYNRISLLTEIPVSNFVMLRIGLESISSGFDVRDRYKHKSEYRNSLQYRTYNVRLGATFYLDAKP